MWFFLNFFSGFKGYIGVVLGAVACIEEGACVSGVCKTVRTNNAGFMYTIDSRGVGVLGEIGVPAAIPRRAVTRIFEFFSRGPIYTVKVKSFKPVSIGGGSRACNCVAAAPGRN